jgi:hypothetical protein
MTLDELHELDGLICYAIANHDQMRPMTTEEMAQCDKDLAFNGVLDIRIGRWGMVDLQAREIEAERNRIPFGEVGPWEGSSGFYECRHPDGRVWSLTPPGVLKLVKEKGKP